MTPAEALRRAALAGRLGRFEVSWHASQRMKERNVTRGDIAEALITATHATAASRGRFHLSGGGDLQEAPLSVVIALVNGCVVVTVF